MKSPGCYYMRLLVLILFLQACRNHDRDAEYYRRTDEQLQTAASSVNRAAEEVLHSIERKMQQHGEYTPAAMKLYSVMLDVNAKATDVSETIAQVRAMIIKDAGSDPYSAGRNVVNKHLLGDGVAKKLWMQLTQLRLLTDSLTLHILPEDKKLKLGIDSIKTEEDFLETYFNGAWAGMALVNLSSLQHDAAEVNYFAAKFMGLNMGETSIRFSLIDVDMNITQSARQIKPGEPVKITADIRDFTLRSEPKVFINNMPVDAPDGIAATLVKAEGNGLQSIPVVVRLKRKDGVQDSVVRSVVYKVIEATKF